MFKDLQPLLAKRSLTITVAALNGEEIRVNVIPHSRPEDKTVNEQIKYSHKDEIAAIPDAAVKALTTPISLTGKPEEIDAKVSDVLLQFVESHTGLQATFDRACTEISDAVKAIDERNKNKSKAKTAGSKTEQKEEPSPATANPKLRRLCRSGGQTVQWPRLESRRSRAQSPRQLRPMAQRQTANPRTYRR